MGTTLITPKARLSFPHLFEARAMEEGQEKKFGCALLFDEAAQQTPAFKAMQLAALTAAKAKWGDKAVPMIKDRMLRMPFRRGEEKSDYEGYGPGIVFINATTKQRPGVVNGQVQKILDPGEVYAGCYVYAEINPFTYDTKGNKGVSFGLNNIQKCANGESIGGRAPAEQVFKPLADDEGTIDGSVDEVFA